MQTHFYTVKQRVLAPRTPARGGSDGARHE